MAVLVTGAAGFIGSYVCEALLARGERVIGVDNFDAFYDRSWKERNLAAVRARGGSFALHETDICDEAFRGLAARERPTGIIHLAAKAGVRPSIADPAGYARANVLGTAVVLDAAHKAGCTKVVVASSSSVYGNAPQAPFSETMDVNEPVSPYAATKRSCEILGHAHWHLTGMPTAMLRFFTVFGPRQRPDLAIMSFLRRAATSGEISVFGDGSTSRDYTYIDDIVSGVLAAWDRIGTPPIPGFRIWNLGGNRPVTLADMLATIERVVGRKLNITRLPMQAGDVERTWADLTRSGAELGYAAKTGFEEGVRRQWEWVRSTL